MAWLTDDDFYFWNQGTHFKSYDRLGAHPDEGGTWFAVWAPHAERIAVIGTFNGWDPAAN
ncbi:MAG: hypothetical protein R3362_09785, partial [Rhodothermales bacterium]|nr:hypothetical protein [Rhodothermales bacterium]